MNKKISKTIFSVILIALIGHYVFLLSQNNKNTNSVNDSLKITERYYCGMHPSVVSNFPGKCPICGMDLQKEEVQKKEHKHQDRKILFYKHPMGKNVTSPTPMKDEMGMDFIPVYEDEIDSSADEVYGRVPFQISQENQQIIGVKKEKIKKGIASFVIRASGRVAYDLELYQTLSDYKAAVMSASATAKSNFSNLEKSSTELLNSTKLKLQLMGFSEEQLKQFQSQGFNPKELLLPKDKVWIYADVYEYEVASLKVGQKVEAQSPVFADKNFSGEIFSINPVLNPETRTLTVRALVEDKEHVLKPQVFLNVRINVSLGEQLLIPETAVIHTGDKNIAFLVNEQNNFDPYEVIVGPKIDNYYVLEKGLKEGDLVVTSANFLIDSESRLRAVTQEALKKHNDK